MLCGRDKNRTYVGYSPDPYRRLRQHNGKLCGGAAPVAGRPWSLVLFVGGFRTKHAALTFEAAWWKPHEHRRMKRQWSMLGLPKCSPRSRVNLRMRALDLLLQHGAWVSEALEVYRVAR